MKKRVSILALAAAATVAGCHKHHRVTDPTSGREYYTDDLKIRRGQAVFTDEITDARVNLDSFQKEKITKREFRDKTR